MLHIAQSHNCIHNNHYWNLVFLWKQNIFEKVKSHVKILIYFTIWSKATISRSLIAKTPWWSINWRSSIKSPNTKSLATKLISISATLNKKISYSLYFLDINFPYPLLPNMPENIEKRKSKHSNISTIEWEILELYKL